MTKTERIKHLAKLELARREFFFYCQLMQPDFYRHDRNYQVELCNTMQQFIEDKEDDILVINVPPRHGKSLTATKLVEWYLGNHPQTKIMTGSYNERLSMNFAKMVRNTIQEERLDDSVVVYNDVFPTTKLKYGEASANHWALEGQHSTYLATSPTGTATGFGASLIIVDDIIKNAMESNNERILEEHWNWFTNTMLSRLESGGQVMVIATRWHSKDLAGQALSLLPELGYRVKHINLKAKQDDGSMLCEDILNLKEFERKTKTMAPEIASANYQQEPIDVKGRLYQQFNTYTSVPEFKRIESYTDTADTGKDYLVTYIYGITADDQIYILDVIYTRDSMEVTEPLLAKMLYQHEVNIAHIESNNGGRGFSRNVQRILRDQHGSNKTIIKAFHQSKNKEARIYSSSAWVQQNVLFPEGWNNKWRELHDDLMSYQREGKNKHDDAQDALAGIFDKTVGQRDTWLV